MASLIHEPGRPRKPWRVSWLEKRRRRTRRFATKREAQVFIGDLARGSTALDSQRMSLKAWLAHWLRTYGPAWEPRTVHDRGDAIDDLIVPYLGTLRLGEIGRSDVREWRAALIRSGKTVYTAEKAMRVLSAALGAAVEDDLLPANPCRGVRRLPRPVDRRRPATLAETEAIRAAMPSPGDRVVVSLMAYAGLRPGEVRALRWSDVRDRTLVVRSSMSGKVEKTTKTGSARTVPLIRPLADDLASLGEERLGPAPAEAGPLGRADGIAAVDAAKRAPQLVVRIPDWDNWTMRVFRPARRLVGAEVPPYSLRHTFASLQIAAGLNPWQVAALLGHTTPAMVIRTYGHLFAEAELAAPTPVEPAVILARAHACSVGVMRGTSTIPA